MSSSPTVVVKKGGALTALISGIFGTLIVCILCAVALVCYALNIADRKVSDVMGIGQALAGNLAEWSESLPPAVADLLSDRRAPDYREQIDAHVRVVPDRRRSERGRLVVEVTNNGSEVVTLLTARIVFLDEDGVPLRETRTFAATPLSLDEGEWRGPLQPGSTRHYSELLRDGGDVAEVAFEITDLRVWTAPELAEPAATASVAQPELPAP